MRITLLHASFLQIVKFLSVGGIVTVFDYGVFLIGFTRFGIEPVHAALLGYIAGGILSYVLSRRYVFLSDRSHHNAGLRFALVMVSGFFLTGLCMALFVEALFIDPAMSRIMTYLIILVFNFLAHRFFTFGH